MIRSQQTNNNLSARRTLVFGLITGLLVAGHTAYAADAARTDSTSAQSNPPSLKQQVERAYDQTDTYHSKVNYRMVMHDGRWKRSRQASTEIAFDRTGRKLRIDRPGVLLSADGQYLRLKIQQIEGKYLKHKQSDQPISLAMLEQTLPALGHPAFADMLLLISDTPWADMVSAPGSASRAGMGQAKAKPTIEQVPASDSSRARLKVTGPGGVMTLEIDPKTHLIRKARFKVDPQRAGLDQGDTVREVFKIDVRARNDSLAEQTFAFKAGDAEAVDSIAALAGSRGGPTAGRPHPLTGKPAPPVNLARADGGKFQLKDVQADVIVLDFWATWCGPCRMSLPRMQAVADWADQKDKSVAIYTVNQGESKEKAKAYWKRAGFTMPILLDQNMRASQAYRVRGIPYTVMIHEGKVKKVRVGVMPKGTIKNDIKAILGQS